MMLFRQTKLGMEKITRDLPTLNNNLLNHLVLNLELFEKARM